MARLELPDGSYWDWEVMSWTGGTLTLAAGTDLVYHHQVEVIFSGVQYVATPSTFHHPTFRQPTDDELRAVGHQIGGRPPVVVAFDHDEQDDAGMAMSGLIAADAVEVVAGTVYRYRRDDLKPGERQASWLSEPTEN